MKSEEENVFARFYDKVIKTDRVKENNMPVFEECTYIEIAIPDDRDVVNRRADQEDIDRFPAEYNRYLNNKKKMIEGTPLNQFSFLTAIQMENCRYFGIETVEELAGLDEDKAKTMGISDERLAAETFLENAKSFAEKEQKYEKEIEELKAENEKLKAEIEALKTPKEDKKTSNK